MPCYSIRTLGCKANLADSQAMEERLRALGWISSEENEGGPVDLFVVNSCSVTAEAEKQSRKIIEKLKREHPDARIVMTGCADVLQKRAESGAARAEGWLSADELFAELPAKGGGPETRRTRGLLKIEEGCDSFCSYCIVPFARGPVRSIPADQAVRQVRSLVEAGHREVVLTGTNIGRFGSDADTSLDVLVARILEETDLPRLRLSSLAPPEITPALLRLCREEPRFCPHFHVSLQSPSTEVLKQMKRRYDADQVRDCLLAIAEHRPTDGDVFVGMDLICGFPGETEKDFEWSLERLAGLPWSRLHVFPYSERPGTLAAHLPGTVPVVERKRRAAAFRKLSLKRLERIHRKVLDESICKGSTLTDILIEGPITLPGGELAGESLLCGYTRNYLRVALPSSCDATSGELRQAVPHSLHVDARAGEVTLLCC